MKRDESREESMRAPLMVNLFVAINAPNHAEVFDNKRDSSVVACLVASSRFYRDVIIQGSKVACAPGELQKVESENSVDFTAPMTSVRCDAFFRAISKTLT